MSPPRAAVPLTALDDLKLGNNRISDIEPLQNLTNLMSLELQDNLIADIGPLENLTRLTNLELDNNQIGDVQALADLTGLTSLDLYNNQIADIGPLENLTDLTSLDLTNNRVSNLQPLRRHTGLVDLWLGHNEISNVEALTGLTNLARLELDDQELSAPIVDVGDVTPNPVVDQSGDPVPVISTDPGFSFDPSANVWSFSRTGAKWLTWDTPVVIGAATATFSGRIAQQVAPQTLLRVETSPPVASQISIDGEWADTWAVDGLEVTPGLHEVCFTDVPGFTAPDCTIVSVSPRQTTTHIGEFVERGHLRVTTHPAVPAQITIDGRPANNWGVWTDLPPRDYEVCFGAVAGHDPPDCETVTVTAGDTAHLIGEFTENAEAAGASGVGMLRVVTHPAVPSQITIDGHIADTWGLDWLQIDDGAHLVCFGDVPGYATPGCELVYVFEGETRTIIGEFTQLGYLQVTTDPGTPAQITVDGIRRDGWGVFTQIAPGFHQVCFADPAGTSPPCERVPVIAGRTTAITARY